MESLLQNLSTFNNIMSGLTPSFADINFSQLLFLYLKRPLVTIYIFLKNCLICVLF
ncbi:hypothetical protein Syun_025747 [Stephania yunnanensis]|uniref:Uncharacterized protein n=1 Tax=Stephania yunnanensis TaxID=152371 RepID=A0AAP0EXL2_9MAGN